MNNIQKVRCPNCGNYAEKRYFIKQDITQISCSICDYLMINITTSGKVIEAYAPGISVRTS